MTHFKHSFVKKKSYRAQLFLKVLHTYKFNIQNLIYHLAQKQSKQRVKTYGMIFAMLVFLDQPVRRV